MKEVLIKPRKMRPCFFDNQQDKLLHISKGNILISPHPDLQQYIAYYTVLFPSLQTKKGKLNLVPEASGCFAIVFYGENLEVKYWGPVSNMRQVNKDISNIDLLVLVELRPGGGHDLLGVPMHILHNAIVPLEAIDKCFHDSIKSVFTRVEGSPSLFINSLNQIFLQQLRRQKKSLLIQNVVNQLVASSGNIRIKDLASFTGYTERHISRLCTEYVGMSPKHIARIIRINAACHAIQQSSSHSLTELAHLLEFYDQAHFDHEFKNICGVSPAIYAQKMSDFYNDNLKFFPI